MTTVPDRLGSVDPLPWRAQHGAERRTHPPSDPLDPRRLLHEGQRDMTEHPAAPGRGSTWLWDWWHTAPEG
jgi:hypothetical protein